MADAKSTPSYFSGLHLSELVVSIGRLTVKQHKKQQNDQWRLLNSEISPKEVRLIGSKNMFEKAGE